MAFKLHYRTISSYRELPPRIREIYSESERLDPTTRYLADLDRFVQQATPRTSYAAGDIVSQVFVNRSLGHELSSHQLAELIQERRALNEKHLAGVQWRLNEMLVRKPLRTAARASSDDFSLTEVERQILELEKQKRTLELNLWRDTHELRVTLMDERKEQESMRRRLGYFAGGEYARA